MTSMTVVKWDVEKCANSYQTYKTEPGLTSSNNTSLPARPQSTMGHLANIFLALAIACLVCILECLVH